MDPVVAPDCDGLILRPNCHPDDGVVAEFSLTSDVANFRCAACGLTGYSLPSWIAATIATVSGPPLGIGS